MTSRTCRDSEFWLAEDPGALPSPPQGRDGHGVILCLLLSLVLMGGLVLVQGVRLVLPELGRIEEAFTLDAGAAILPPEQGRTGGP
ncbi:hypothetical protein [Neotabrizicola sp. sgz301269]|uniref:hypothetical protein n=1 Tax=Neotabrizicola sp. sgz301269 TaxID=3276282 RepID=UPI00376F502B